jgi:hypothetical protein
MALTTFRRQLTYKRPPSRIFYEAPGPRPPDAQPSRGAFERGLSPRAYARGARRPMSPEAPSKSTRSSRPPRCRTTHTDSPPLARSPFGRPIARSLSKTFRRLGGVGSVG